MLFFFLLFKHKGGEKTSKKERGKEGPVPISFVAAGVDRQQARKDWGGNPKSREEWDWLNWGPRAPFSCFALVFTEGQSGNLRCHLA